ncbi:MAG: hypothetical protein NZ920_04230 [Aigarchaeota archaeon]|nr:hypothetical protein [Aigarchaeota archaeon]MDW8092171.1 hypothetical protein [Nitrososphaerota archaeon]
MTSEDRVVKYVIHAKVSECRSLISSIPAEAEHKIRSLSLGPRSKEGWRDLVIELEATAEDAKRLIDAIGERCSAGSLLVRSFPNLVLHDLRYPFTREGG